MRFALALVLSCLCLVVLSLLGRPILAPSVLTQPDSLDVTVFWTLRFPKFLLAFGVGAALSLCGATFQALLRNPLADPYILGVSGGAALGYVLALVFGVSALWHPFFGFLSALLWLMLLYRLASRQAVLSVFRLLLMGVVLNAFSFALILVLNAVVSFGQSQQILFLLVGSIEPQSASVLGLSGFVVLGSSLFLFSKARVLDLLSLGDDRALSLGVAVDREKKVLFVVTSVLVGVVVSLAGLIGFVGLVVPHLVRLVVGASHQKLLPWTFLGGGLGLAVCEFVASYALAFETVQTRFPVGAVTALVGAPVFVWLLGRKT